MILAAPPVSYVPVAFAIGLATRALPLPFNEHALKDLTVRLRLLSPPVWLVISEFAIVDVAIGGVLSFTVSLVVLPAAIVSLIAQNP